LEEIDILLIQRAPGKLVFISCILLIFITLHPLYAQTDDESISELNARITQVAEEATTVRLITGWGLTGAGAGYTIATLLLSPHPSEYQTTASIESGLLMAVPGLLFLLIPTEAEYLRSEFASLSEGSEKGRTLKRRRGEGMLETLAIHGKRARRAGAYAWFVVAAIELFAYTMFSGELQHIIPTNDFTAYSFAWFGAIIATGTTGVLHLLIKSRAELEWEAYLAWRENPQAAAARPRLPGPVVRLAATPIGISLVMEF
jgi:hypothetical protein